MSKLLYTDNDWTFEKIKVADQAIKEIALEELKLDVYPNQIEIISSDQMIDAYASHAMPVMYDHWSFGKKFLKEKHKYQKGYSGLAYEVVVNTNPCIAYLMEENSMTMQTLVIAHACYGHNHVFKNNYLFRQWTDAEAIIDYLVFAKKYIASCEEKYGYAQVERTLDACHAIMDYGVDKYSRPAKLNKQKEQEQQEYRAEQVQRQANELWSTIPTSSKNSKETADRFPAEPQENLMYFIEKHSPVLECWQRELVRIVRKISQYFMPQRYTKVLNEGWATFTHYYIMNRLWEQERISDGNYLEFLHSHTGVVYQPEFNSGRYYGYNPYALGFDIFSEIRRICTEPTKEDQEYFPHLVGKNWLEECLHAVRDFQDESFISQYLSPNLVRKWRLFEITDRARDPYITVTNIQDSRGYDNVRQSLSKHFSSARLPNIQVFDADLKGSRELKLLYTPQNSAKLDDNTNDVVKYVRYLWGHEVKVLDLSDL